MVPLIAALLAGFAAAAQGKPAVYGFNLPTWQAETYAKKETLRSLKALKKTGAKWVAFTPTWYVERLDSVSIARTSSTPTDASLKAVIRWARKLGLKVVLKPHIDVLTEEFRGALKPADEDAWFKSYEEFILGYAGLAESTGCSLFIVGTELSSLSGPFHGKRWDRIIGLVRERYSGKLTYAANWDAVHLTPFWERLDYIGVDGYYPVPGADAAGMRVGWAVHKAHLAVLAARWGRPLLFTEIGLTSQTDANMKPAEWKPFGKLDRRVQGHYISAFLDEFLPESWFAGFLYWAWETDPGAGGLDDRTMTVQGKPASIVLSSYFSRFK